MLVSRGPISRGKTLITANFRRFPFKNISTRTSFLVVHSTVGANLDLIAILSKK